MTEELHRNLKKSLRRYIWVCAGGSFLFILIFSLSAFSFNGLGKRARFQQALNNLPQAACDEVGTVEEYAAWLEKTIEYKDQQISEWAAPGQALLERQGDCKDLAFLTAAILRMLGYSPKVLAVANPDESHAFCVLKKDGNYMVFNNNKLIRTKLTSLKDFASYFLGSKKYKYLIELKPDKDDSQMLFKRETRPST